MHLLPTVCGLLTVLSPVVESSAFFAPRAPAPEPLIHEERYTRQQQQQHNPNQGKKLLRPAVRLNIDRKSLEHFEPTNTTNLFFAESRLAYEDALAASLTATTHDLAVSLDDSEHFLSHKCEGTSMTIKFDDLQSYRQARKLWPNYERITFISADDSCEPTAAFGFFRSTSIYYDERKLMARPVGQVVQITEAVQHFDIGWGTFKHNETHRKEYLRKRGLQHAEVNLEKRSDHHPYHDVRRTVVPRAAAPAVSPIPAPGVYVANCKTYPVSPILNGMTCGKRGTINKFSILKPYYAIKDELTCATDCLANPKCGSYAFDPAKVSCQQFSKTLAQQAWIYNPKATILYSERNCWGCWICGTRPNTPLPAGISYTGPQLACGGDFDKQLDAQIGLSKSQSGFSSGGVLSGLFPGVDTSQTFFSLKKRDAHGEIDDTKHLDPRFWGELWDGFVNIVNKVVDFVVQVVQAVKAVAEAVLNTVVGGITLLTGGTWSPTLGPFELPVYLGPPQDKLEDTPFFGDGRKGYKVLEYEAKESDDVKKYTDAAAKVQELADKFGVQLPEQDKKPSLTVYCVDCGVTGEFSFEGHASFSLTEFKELGASMTGKLHAGLMLGVNAFYQKEFSSDPFQLASASLGGFYIPAVITVGPMVSLAADAKLTVTAEGQLFGGIELDWPEMKANIDFKDNSKSGSSGFKPDIKYEFWAKGSLGAEVSLGLPISVGVGIEVLDGKLFKEQIAIVTRPYVAASAQYSVATSQAPTSKREPVGLLDAPLPVTALAPRDCSGIDWKISTGVDFLLDVVATTFNLGKWEGPTIASGCLAIGQQVAPTSLPPPTDRGSGSAVDLQSGQNTLGDYNSLINGAKHPTAPTGFDINVLYDPSKQIKLYTAQNGNFLMGLYENLLPGTNFIGRNGVVFMDESTRLLSYQPAVMNAYNASRLRALSPGDTPVGSKGLTLSPITSNGKSTYVAQDSSGGVFLLAFCNAPNQWDKGSHIFLVKDYDQSLKGLLRYTIQYAVTGAEVVSCQPLVVTSDKASGVTTSN